MLIRENETKVYLAIGNTDMRKSIDGLAIIVKEAFDLEPFSNCIFAFCNKYRDKIKILQWDNNGFWLHYKRLEKDKFKWPKSDKEALMISKRELIWLLDGLELKQMQAHKKIEAKILI